MGSFPDKQIKTNRPVYYYLLLLLQCRSAAIDTEFE